MGRKKGYDRDILAREAMEIFRDNGFAGTSAQMLVDRLGINRFSLYAEFGNKQGLFDAALKAYDEQIITRNFGPLEQPGAGVDEVQRLFAFFGGERGAKARGRGCFLCNAAVEFGAEDPTGAAFVKRYFERVSKAFASALGNAHRAGQLRTEVKPRDEARFFTATVLGLFVMLRAEAPRAVIQVAAKAARDHLDGLRA